MASPDPDSGAARRLALGAALAAAGALGAWPAARGGADPVAALAWLAVLAPAAGALAAGRGLGFAPWGWIVPALWLVPVLLASRPPRSLPTLGWALLAWTGLFALGAAVGALALRRDWNCWATAGAVLLVAGALALLPARGALGTRPWPPVAARVLLDLSPSALVVESAGVDWMRHPAVYDPVGTDRFERRPWRGALAGPTLLLVGCALVACARLVPARRVRS